jgi:uncharacterized protein YjbI with pentapeptide repeats
LSDYISILEFARQVGTSRQAVYPRLKADLQPYVKTINGQKAIHIDALQLYGVKPEVALKKYLKEDLKVEDLKAEDLKVENLKAEDLKAEDLKVEDLKKEDLKKEDLKAEDLKKEDLKADFKTAKIYENWDNDEKSLLNIEIESSPTTDPLTMDSLILILKDLKKLDQKTYALKKENEILSVDLLRERQHANELQQTLDIERLHHSQELEKIIQQLVDMNRNNQLLMAQLTQQKNEIETQVSQGHDRSNLWEWLKRLFAR